MSSYHDDDSAGGDEHDHDKEEGDPGKRHFCFSLSFELLVWKALGFRISLKSSTNVL